MIPRTMMFQPLGLDFEEIFVQKIRDGHSKRRSTKCIPKHDLFDERTVVILYLELRR